MPCVEIGWRLMQSAWEQGYVTEGASALIGSSVPLPTNSLVSLTAAVNTPGSRVMEKLGFLPSVSEDFLHPLLDPGSPLAHHVLYRYPNNL